MGFLGQKYIFKSKHIEIFFRHHGGPNIGKIIWHIICVFFQKILGQTTYMFNSSAGKKNGSQRSSNQIASKH
jgi:hypothetical protein